MQQKMYLLLDADSQDLPEHDGQPHGREDVRVVALRGVQEGSVGAA